MLTLAFMPSTSERNSPVAQPGLISSEFIFENAPFPSAHASTIVETKAGLIAAWFGGTDEGRPDVGIWTSRNEGKGWMPPVEVARWDDGGKRLPCWNPVLFQPKAGLLWLFYKDRANDRERLVGDLDRMEKNDGKKTLVETRSSYRTGF